jgi:hypothetical protein
MTGVPYFRVSVNVTAHSFEIRSNRVFGQRDVVRSVAAIQFVNKRREAPVTFLFPDS